MIPWDFLSRSEYSLGDSNPRRRIHNDVKEGLEDITREVMTSINACSRQRGRIVEERSTLYGYRRVDSYGADTILDLLLVYRKYRGRKVTLPVRRHVYIHQHFTGTLLSSRPRRSFKKRRPRKKKNTNRNDVSKDVSSVKVSLAGLEIRETVDGEEVDEARKDQRNDKSLQNIFRGGFLNLNFNYEQEDPVTSKIIHFVLPLSGKHDVFRRFLRNYEEICLTSGERTTLSVILYRHKTEDSFDRTTDSIERLKYKYRSANIDVVPASGTFSRAKALNLGASRLNDNDLMFFVDVDIAFTESALHRIRANTLLGRQIYFPVVFSQYNPKTVRRDNRGGSMFVVDETSGYWRQFGFGIVSLYKQEYKTVGGFDLSIQGWGKEDVDFYEKVVKSNVKIFRAADTDLVHVYHDVECSKDLPETQWSMCMGTKADTFAGTEALAKMIYENPEILRFAKARRANLTRAAGTKG